MAKATTKSNKTTKGKKTTASKKPAVKSASAKKTAASKKQSAAKKKSTTQKQTATKKQSPAKKQSTAKKQPASKKQSTAKKQPETKKQTTATKSTAKKTTAPESKAATKKEDITTSKKGYPKMAERRLEQLRFTLEDIRVDGLVITNIANIRYITNFSGSSAIVIILKDSIHFFTDDRYEEQVKTELYPLPNLHIHITRDVWETAKKNKVFKNVNSLAFEADSLPYGEAVEIRNRIRPVKFKPSPDEIERFTRPKAPEELENIKKACKMAEDVYNKILDFIQPGMTEKELATEIAHQSRLHGSEGDAFPIIAVSGPRAALVHGQPSDKKIKKNEIILLDFGCVVNGFRSDITRTFVIGKATKEQKDIYKMLRQAQKAACSQVRPGMNGKHLDAVARDIVKKAGFGDNFQHSLGHGLGIITHEKPIITFRKSDQIIPDECVLAIEPGVYLPGKFGIRVEDDIFVTKNGGKYLTNAPEELPVI